MVKFKAVPHKDGVRYCLNSIPNEVKYMNSLLILRCELVCVIFLLSLFTYNLIYSRKKQRSFLIICLIAFAHVIFDGVTVYTVNNIGAVSPLFNVLFHLCMYFFAVLFSCEVLCYILQNIDSRKSSKKIITGCRIFVAVYLIVLPFLNIEYISGNGTMYSVGPAAVFSYITAFTYLIAGIVVLILNIRKLDRRFRLCLFPTMIFMVLITLVQIIIPELLFTGGAITIITTGIFFTIETPVENFRKQASIDIDTGILSKKSYEDELPELNEKYFSEERAVTDITVIVCDVKGVKTINDRFGRTKGDEVIVAAAKIIGECLTSAHRLYRIGGDEFIAVYVGENTRRTEEETTAVRESAKKAEGLPTELGISIGLSSKSKGESGDLLEIIALADLDMYKNKRKENKETITA